MVLFSVTSVALPYSILFVSETGTWTIYVLLVKALDARVICGYIRSLDTGSLKALQLSLLQRKPFTCRS